MKNVDKKAVEKAYNCVKKGPQKDFGLGIECKFCPYGKTVRMNDTDILENRVCDRQQVIADAKEIGIA